MAPIALISVSEKKGIAAFAKALSEVHGFQIISSGGTAKLLKEEGIAVTKVADYTGYQEILDGRVKTLHPKIHGGILAKKNDSSHSYDLIKNGIQHIDLVIVNLYPFKETVSAPNVSWEKAIENIDIGGPAMLRAAAKNHDSVIVLSNPNQYQLLLNSLKVGKISKEQRQQFALKAFEHTADYDIAISQWMKHKIEPEKHSYQLSIPLKQTLRYGENPHQKAGWFSYLNQGWGNANQLQGKELSTNNLIDLDGAISIIREFDYGEEDVNQKHTKAAAIIKHTNPCGVAIDRELDLAFCKALAGDPVSAFGGIVALNSSVDLQTANKLSSLFLECIVAPGFDDNAQEILSQKKNLRLLTLTKESIIACSRDNFRSILGGVLVQEIDDLKVNQANWEIVTESKPDIKEMQDLEFAWRIVRHVKSNAIVVANSGQTIGIGAGQMNRVGAAKIALEAAGAKAKGAVLASDGFLPFDDTVRLASKYGIKAIIQPGGSIKDEASILACNELNLSMITTGRRHFLH